MASMKPESDRPGVLALPPLIYLATVGAGLILHWLLPLVMPLPAAMRWAGAGLVLAGFILAGVARTAFARAGTNVNPTQPAIVLVTSGPYGFSRNPMYIALAMIFIGLTLLTRVGWLLILLPVVVAIMHWGVVLREERYLASKFGIEYETYFARVRRYF